MKTSMTLLFLLFIPFLNSQETANIDPNDFLKSRLTEIYNEGYINGYNLTKHE